MSDDQELLRQMLAELKEHNELSRKLLVSQEKTYWHVSQSRVIQDAIRMEISRPTIDEISAFYDERQLSLSATIERLRDNRVNMSRFGDGEIKLMFREGYDLAFQKNSPQLRAELFSVFDYAESNPHKLLVGMVPMITDQFWTTFYSEFWRVLKPLLSSQTFLGNSHISRPRMFLEHGRRGVDMWRELWDGLKVAVVAGEGSRFELEPALLSNAHSVVVESSLPKNAFADLDRLEDRLAGSDYDLVLVSLGPAGSILPKRLAERNKWALDIGHLTSSYAQVFDGKPAPEATPLIK